MPKNGGGPNNNQFRNGLTYNARVPAFLQALKKQVDGSGSSSRPRDGRSESPVRVREGRDAIPERPRDGPWAEGSDDEGGDLDEFGRARRRSPKGKDKASDQEEDEWDKRFGGGKDDDGPQIVVVNEGKHLTAEQYKQEREKVKGQSTDGESWNDLKKEARGAQLSTLASMPVDTKPPIKPTNTFGTSAKVSVANNKRKLVSDSVEPPKSAKQSKKDKKKEKEKKGLLSFGDEDEG